MTPVSDLLHARDAFNTRLETVIGEYDKLVFQQIRIAAILATFYRAELSMSSVQPILALALEMNPNLVERAR
jgi:hypothetical protein